MGRVCVKHIVILHVMTLEVSVDSLLLIWIPLLLFFDLVLVFMHCSVQAVITSHNILIWICAKYHGHYSKTVIVWTSERMTLFGYGFLNKWESKWAEISVSYWAGNGDLSANMNWLLSCLSWILMLSFPLRFREDKRLLFFVDSGLYINS